MDPKEIAKLITEDPDICNESPIYRQGQDINNTPIIYVSRFLPAVKTAAQILAKAHIKAEIKNASGDEPSTTNYVKVPIENREAAIKALQASPQMKYLLAHAIFKDTVSKWLGCTVCGDTREPTDGWEYPGCGSV
jgi:hypothetical protein